MTKTEIQAEIAKYEKRHAAAGSPDEKEFAQKKIDKLKAELEKSEDKIEEKKEEKKEKVAKKAAPKKVAKKAAKTHKEKPAKKTAKKAAKKVDKPAKKEKVKKLPKGKLVIKYHDKEYVEGEADFCEILVKSMKEKKAAIKKAAKKHKSVSISTKIGEGIVHQIEQAINHVDKEEIKDNPKEFIAKFDRLEKAGMEFIKAFRAILGSDYNAKDIQEPMEQISELVETIKKRYKK
jgi:hypothetical protein